MLPNYEAIECGEVKQETSMEKCENPTYHQLKYFTFPGLALGADSTTADI